MVRLVGTVGYAASLNGIPIIISKVGSSQTAVVLLDVTNPQNIEVVYSWSSSFEEPGGISELDDTVNLHSGRLYALYFNIPSSESVQASSPTVGSPAVVSARCSGGAGNGALLSVLFMKDGSSEVSPDVIRSDVNGDGCVDDEDLLAVLFCLGNLVNVGEEDVNLRVDCLSADVNMDGFVDDSDLLTVLLHLGTCYF